MIPTSLASARLDVVRIDLGNLRVHVLHDGLFRLDGGAMFGVVPRTLWERRTIPDERNRIALAMRPMLVEGDWGRLLVDCGAGDAWTEKERDVFAFDRARTLVDALDELGLSPETIPLVVPTHLHWDHCGGGICESPHGPVPTFPNARYLIRQAEWEDATHPHARNRASYRTQDFMPLRDAGVVDFFDGDHEVRPGVRVVRTGGHTGQHQIVRIESGGRTLVFPADLIPTTAHVNDAWIPGYDLFPMETLRVKQQLVRDAVDQEHVVVFEHDPLVAAGYIREQGGQRYVEPLLN